ncbi:MAG: hypothetical protein GMKNLPBB_02445 [Myxococcota bacterium]|nr:hypothetical protein [Myxococcota bacterium]
MKLANPELLAAGMALLLVLVLHARARRRRARTMAILGDPGLISRLVSGESAPYRVSMLVFLLLGLGLSVLALARPQFGGRVEKIRKKGVDIVIALDTSKSMLAADVEPSRLERAKRELSLAMNRFQELGHRAGLVVFAGDAFVQCPITSDFEILRLFLDSADAMTVGRGGTNLARALDEARGLLNRDWSDGPANNKEEQEAPRPKPSGKRSRAVLLLSDGESHEGNIHSIVSDLVNDQIRVFAIGIGSTVGEPIPVNPEAERPEYRTDSSGQVIMSRLNEEPLRILAQETGGVYVQADSATLGLGRIIEEIHRMEGTEYHSRVVSRPRDLYQWLLWPAFACLAFALLINHRREAAPQTAV